MYKQPYEKTPLQFKGGKRKVRVAEIADTVTEEAKSNPSYVKSKPYQWYSGGEMKEGVKHSDETVRSIDNTRHLFPLQATMDELRLKGQLSAAQKEATTLRAQVEGLQVQVEEAKAKAKEQLAEAKTQVATLHKQLADEVPSITSIVAVLTTLALVILAKANY